MKRVIGAIVLLLLAALAAAQGHAPAGPLSAPVRRIDGVACVGANDLSRLLDGSKYWRADVRKLVVRAQGHRFTFTADNPIVLLDDRTLRLESPVRSLGGELQVPVGFLAMLPRDSTQSRLSYDASASRVRLSPPGGYVAAPQVAVTEAETRVVLVGERAAEASVSSRDRRHFRVRLPGVLTGTIADSLPAGSLVLSLRRAGGADGITLELVLAAEATGFRLDAAPGRATLVFARAGELEPFAPEGPAGPRALRVVVLDPGHGGADAGVQAEGVIEKDLSLQLARALGTELERRGVRVVLTRSDDRAVAPEQRAEIANRAHADLVISLHFDGFVSPVARGATAWCAPASFAETRRDDRTAALSPVAMTPWRDVAMRHAVESRALAEAVALAMDDRAQGPARVRERLALPLLGVNAPGISLECAMLTNPADRQRVTGIGGTAALALSITEGILAWQRHD